MADIDNLNLNDPCISSFINMNDDVRNHLNHLDREGLRALTPAVQGSRTANTIDGAYEVYVNLILSNPKTIALNATSSLTPIATRVFDTVAAAGFSKLDWHSVDKVHFRDAIAEVQGIGDGLVDAFRFLNAVAKSPTTALESVLARQGIPAKLAEQAKVDRARRVITGENIENAILSAGAEWIGRTINFPGSTLTTTDIFYKIIHHRATVSKLAMRQALNEGLTGIAAQQRYAELRTQAFAEPADMSDPTTINAQALFDADERTWTNRPEGVLNQWMAGSNDKGFLRWFVPFRRTMVNLFNYGVDSTPLGVVKALPQYLALSNTRTGKALLTNGPERAEALGRMAVGTMLLTAIWQLIGDDVDGDAPRNEQAAAHWRMNGHKEYTYRAGSRHLPLDMLGQFAPFVKAIVDTQTAMAQISYVNDPDADNTVMDLAGTLLIETAEQFLNTHWVSSLAPLIETLNRFRNDEHNSTEAMVTLGGRMFASFVPAAFKWGNEEFVDPYMHDLRGLKGDFFAHTKARLFEISKSMPVKIDLWGNPMRYDAWQNPDLVDPITGQDEVYNSMREVGTHIPISRREKFGVVMTPDEYQRYMVLAGKGVNDMPPLRDAIASMMASPLYNSFQTSKAKATLLENIINDYREAAAGYMAMNDPEFSARVKDAQSDEQATFRRQ